MQRFSEIENVLGAYPDDCRPHRVEPLAAAGGFSGARFWRITANRGTLCLRRYPADGPDLARLRWIQSVVAHVAARGFSLLPRAITAKDGEGFCQHNGHLWELSPWMPGSADFWNDRRPGKLRAALNALARFHCAAATFTLQAQAPRFPIHCQHGRSRGIADRLTFTRRLLAGDLIALQQAVTANRHLMPPLADRAEELLDRITPQLPSLEQHLAPIADLDEPVQPCLRDIWHDHVLFQGDRVTGIVDLEAMRIDSVAIDVARLLGSLCSTDSSEYKFGLEAYQDGRPLSGNELALVEAFDRSQRLLAGARWVQWVFADRRSFSDPLAVLKRMDHILERLRQDCVPWSFQAP
jgi:homoserine kinase type II